MTELTYLEPGENDRLSTTPSISKRSTGSSRSLINQVHTNWQVDSLLNTSSLKDGRRPDTGLLEDDWGFDGSSSDDNFSSSVGGVGGSGLVSELDTGSSGSGSG